MSLHYLVKRKNTKIAFFTLMLHETSTSRCLISSLMRESPSRRTSLKEVKLRVRSAVVWLRCMHDVPVCCPAGHNIVISDVFHSSQHLLRQCSKISHWQSPLTVNVSRKKTPITDMVHDIMADMVNVDCVHIRCWMLCAVCLFMFAAYTWSFYDWWIICPWPADNCDAY